VAPISTNSSPPDTVSAQVTPSNQTRTRGSAKAYIARRAKPSMVPGHVKLTFTLDMPREVAERLSAAIREGHSLEAVVIEKATPFPRVVEGQWPTVATGRWPRDPIACSAPSSTSFEG